MNVQGAWSVAGAQDDGAPAAQERPYWLIGLALLVVVLLVLGGAFLLDQKFRPRVGTEPAAGTAGQVVTTPSKTISSEAEVNQLATPLQRDVASAYLRYWAVYGTAMETLNSSRLSEVADGRRLQEAIMEVEDLRAEGVAAKIQVKHSFKVVQATDREATLEDAYVNSSYAVDPVTRNPVGEPGQSQHFVNSYSLANVNGVWKVTDAVRKSSS